MKDHSGILEVGTRRRPAVLPPQATSDGTRRRLQEVALELFAARGYHGVSIRTLAEATGVQSSTLYAHFRSKEELLYSLIDLAHQVHSDALRSALLNCGDDPAEQLKAFVRTHVRLHAEYPTLAIVADKELDKLSEDRARRIVSIRENETKLFGEIIDRGRRLGVFSCPDPILSMAAISAMGLRVPMWFDPSGPYTVEQVADQYADFALRLVR